MRFGLLVVLFIFCGVARALSSLPEDTPIRNLASARMQISTTGYVAAEPQWNRGSMRYKITLDRPEGAVWVSADPHPVHTYGTAVDLSCTLVLPEGNEDFKYERFAAMRGIDAHCTQAILIPSGAVRGSALYRQLLTFKARFQSAIDKSLPEPHASFLGGLLYGLRATISEDLTEAFNITGTTHIIAISGYNITLVSSLFMAALLHLHVRRQHAFWIASSAVIVFVLLVGAQASVVRAAVMATVLLLSQYMGRSGRGAPLLACAAGAMVMVNPYSLVYDVGFQLSFLAVIGLMYLSSDIERLLYRLPGFTKELLAQTLSAIVLTTPLIMYVFGRISVVAPLVNALILPMIPVIMFLGFFGVVLVGLLRPLGLLFFWMSWAAMAYVIWIVKSIATWPAASLSTSASLSMVLAAYALLFLVIRQRYESAG